MKEFTIADRIWNRACLEDVSGLKEGDRLLKAMIMADAYVANGGVLHAVEVRDPDDLFVDAIPAFRYFGRPDVADFLIEARGIYLADEELGEHEAQLDRRYWALVSAGSDLTACFEAVLLATPSAFSPLRA